MNGFSFYNGRQAGPARYGRRARLTFHINPEAITVSQEQDAAFFRNFTLVLVILTLFGIAAAFMGRHFATRAKIDPIPHSVNSP